MGQAPQVPPPTPDRTLGPTRGTQSGPVAMPGAYPEPNSPASRGQPTPCTQGIEAPRP